MGILYLDESGNTGITDKNQTKLLYGGPHVSRTSWVELHCGLSALCEKYKLTIISRLESGLASSSTGIIENYIRLEDELKFLKQFEFHAADIINRKGLWLKLNNNEKFGLLGEVVQLLTDNKVTFYAGILDKTKIPPNSRRQPMIEYKTLFPGFLQFVEATTDEKEQILAIIEGGNLEEEKVLRQSLADARLSKFFGELVIGDSLDFPLLQIADIGLWIIQASERLEPQRKDDHARNIRELFMMLTPQLKILRT